MWEVFRKYHYLNTELHMAAEQWVGIWEDELICHTGIIQFPMRKGWKRVHRLVVLPDYQGVGVGMKFVNAVSEKYVSDGWMVNLTTTTPAIVGALKRSNVWMLGSYGRIGNSMGSWRKYYGTQHKDNKGHGVHHLNNKSSKNRITFSFNYKSALQKKE